LSSVVLCELELAAVGVLVGKNDGSVKGIRYFRCRAQHGVFVRHDKLTHDKRRASLRNTNKTVSKVPSNLRRSTGNLLLKDSNSGAVTNVNISSSLMRPTAASAAKHK